MSEYRTIVGIVQFDPREGEAAKKPVRNIVVNNVDYKSYNVTLWPSHKDFDVKKNDVVVVEGKYNKRNGTKDNAPVTYHNLSAVRISKIGEADAGVQPDVDENEVANDDEIPF